MAVAAAVVATCVAVSSSLQHGVPGGGFRRPVRLVWEMADKLLTLGRCLFRASATFVCKVGLIVALRLAVRSEVSSSALGT